MIKRLIAILLAAAVLTGCQNGDTLLSMNARSSSSASVAETQPETDIETQNEAAEILPDSDILTLSMRMPYTLNPLLNEDESVDRILKLLFEPLVKLDEKQKPQPNIANDLTFSEDGHTLTITLKDGVMWSDGAPLTAADVTFSLDTILHAPDTSLYKSTLKNMTSWSAINSKIVQINYSKAYGAAFFYLCFPVIPKHYYQGSTILSSSVNMSPVGNSVYKFDQYNLAQSVMLSENEYYFGEKPFIKKISILITPDVETDIYAFKESVIDVLNTSMNQWANFSGSKEVTAVEYTNDCFEFVGLNLSNTYLQDKRVRQALAHATPVESIVNNIYLNHAQQAYSAISPDSYCFEPNAKTYAHDLDRATSILNDAGFINMSFSILVNEENSERIKIAEILEENFEKINIKTDIVIKPFEEYKQLIDTRAYDMFIGGLSMTAIPDISFAFNSNSTVENGGQNVFFYKNNSMDIFIGLANDSVTSDAYVAALSEVQKLFTDDLPVISLAFRKSALLINKRIEGGFNPVINNPYENIAQWKIINHLEN